MEGLVGCWSHYTVERETAVDESLRWIGDTTMSQDLEDHAQVAVNVSLLVEDDGVEAREFIVSEEQLQSQHADCPDVDRQVVALIGSIAFPNEVRCHTR